jgi:carbonic anhydrase
MLTLQMESPINLSQATAKPCDLLCELVMDEGNVSSANVLVSDEGLVLYNTAGLGSCKFNGEGYTCNLLHLSHPSHHTIENIQADAEAIAIFTNPTGDYLCVSCLVRANSSQTTSSQFFNAFIGFSSSPQTSVSLGNSWSLNMMVPLASEYFVYDGQLISKNQTKCKWVVFKSMVNMDINDFAALTKNITPSTSSIQPLGNRDVFFNESSQLQGGPMPMDNRMYIKFKRIGPSTKKPKTVQVAGLKDKKAEIKKPSAISEWISSQVKTNGIMEIIDVILLIGSFLVGIYFGYNYGNSSFAGLYVVDKSQNLAKYIRSWFTKDQ